MKKISDFDNANRLNIQSSVGDRSHKQSLSNLNVRVVNKKSRKNSFLNPTHSSSNSRKNSGAGVGDDTKKNRKSAVRSSERDGWLSK